MAVETLKLEIVATNQKAVGALQQTAEQLKKVEVASGKAMSSLSKNTKQADSALMNLSRVAQDAPFGFIAIQNNLNPLLESFQRLKQETGSSATALKQLGQSLMGGAGIGLALSVGSALLIKFGDELFKASAASELAAKSQKEFAESISDATGQAAKETAQLQSLAKIVLDNAQSVDVRERALKQLKETYQGNIDLQKVDIEDSAKLKKALDDLSGAILRKAKANAFADLIAKEEAKRAQLQNATLDDAAAKVSGLEKAYVVFKNTLSATGFATGALTTRLETGARGLDNVKTELSQVNKNIDLYTKLLNDNTLEQVKNNDQATTSKQGLKQMASDFNRASYEAEQLNKQLQARLALTKPIGGGSIMQSTIDRTRPAQGQIGEAQQSGLQRLLEYERGLMATDEALRLYNEYAAEAASITGVFSSAFTDLGTALLQGQSLGAALGNVFRKLAADIAAAAIKALIFKTILGAITGGAGNAIGALGGAKTDFGSIFGRFLGLRLATGAITQGPTPALIGEAGPETVLPLDKLGAFVDRAARIGADSMRGNSQGMNITGEFVARGQDLVLALNRAGYNLSLRR